MKILNLLCAIFDVVFSIYFVYYLLYPATSRLSPLSSPLSPLSSLLSPLSSLLWMYFVTKMLAIQWTVVAALSAFAAFFVESREWTIEHIIHFMPLLLFLAISEGVGFVLMALAQSYTPPTQTAIILSLEGVFTSISRYIDIYINNKNAVYIYETRLG